MWIVNDGFIREFLTAQTEYLSAGWDMENSMKIYEFVYDVCWRNYLKLAD